MRAPKLQLEAAALLLHELFTPQAGGSHCRAALRAASRLPLTLLQGVLCSASLLPRARYLPVQKNWPEGSGRVLACQRVAVQ